MKNEVLKKVRKKLVVQSDRFTEIECLRENLRLYLLSKEMTIYGLAEKANLHVETLKTLLYGNAKDYRGSTVSKLAKALGVTKDELTGSMSKKSAWILSSYEDDFPHRTQQLIDWHFNHQLHELQEHPNEKRITVMTPEINEHGNLKQSNVYECLDISFLDREIIPKIYFGIKIPCNFYEPYYFEGDILLLANDRKPIASEETVIIVNGTLAFVKRRIEKGVANYYSIRDEKLRSVEIPRIEFVGYVVKVLEAK